MKNITKLTFGLLTAILFFSCSEEDENDFLQAGSLKVVHAASGAPPVHVDYFGANFNVNFSINPTLAFATSERFTIPANERRDLRFAYASDTTTEVFMDEISLEAGQIVTYFLLGDSANLSASMIMDTGHKTFTDSANAVRFINMAEGVESLTIGIQDSTVALASSLGFSQGSDFIEVDATLQNENYVFTFKDDSDSLLTSFNFRQYQVFNFPGFFFVNTFALRDNVTLALVGKADDGDGNSALQVVQVNNF